MPARGPPSARSTCASRRAAGRDAGDGAERLLAGARLHHGQLAAGEVLASLSAKSRAVPSWSMPSASQTIEATPAPVSAAAIACAVAVRSGEKGWGCTAAAVERAAAGRLDLQAYGLAPRWLSAR